MWMQALMGVLLRAPLAMHLTMIWFWVSAVQVNHRWVTVLKEDGDQRIHWKSLQVRPPASCCFTSMLPTHSARHKFSTQCEMDASGGTLLRCAALCYTFHCHCPEFGISLKTPIWLLQTTQQA